MKKEAVNTFSDGMRLDNAPLSTQSSVLTHNLNGTLITRNGNEFVLQNDMGNGRVETAFLPAGFVPVGVKEHGGIIYVASHNPLTNKNQLGSFPSPERNIMEEEVKEKNRELVKIEKNEFYTDTLKSGYIKKGLLDEGIKIRPGDKFLIGVEELYDGSLKYVVGSDYNDDKYPQFIRLHLAVIDDNNVISYLEEDEDKNYLTPIEVKKEGDDVGGDFTLDNYRDFIDNNYIVYTNKVSGTLAIIAELEALSAYEVSWNYDITKNEKEKTYDIKLAALNSWQTDSINPYGITHELNVEAKGFPISISYSTDNMQLPNNIKQLPFPEKDGKDPSTNDLELTVSMDDLIKKPLFKYKSTPSMFYGPMNHLSREGVVDLSKINSGIIDLTSYRYYIDNNTLTITWGINSYLKDYQRIESIKLQYISFKDAQNVSGKLDWNHSSIKEVNLKNRINYTGIFNDVFVFGEVFDKNEFYLTRLVVSIIENDKDVIEEYLVRERFLYTTGIFNPYYINKDYQDFNDIKIKGNIVVTTSLETLGSSRPLVDYYNIGPSVSLEEQTNIEESLSFVRNDFNEVYKVNKQVEILDEFGTNRFYGEQQFDSKYELDIDTKKTSITHDLDEDKSYDFIGSGNLSEISKYIKYDTSIEDEYIGIEEEKKKNLPLNVEKFSINKLSKTTFEIKGQEVRKAYFKSNFRNIIFKNIIKPLIDTYDQGELNSEISKLLGHTDYVASGLDEAGKSTLNIKKAFGLNYRTGKGSRRDYRGFLIGSLVAHSDGESNRFKKLKDYEIPGNYNDDYGQKSSFFGGQSKKIINDLCNESKLIQKPFICPTIVGDIHRYDKDRQRTPQLYPTNNLYQEVKGALYRKNGPMPLILGFPVVQKGNEEASFMLINAKTSTERYDGGNDIQGYDLGIRGIYNKPMMNLILTLYSQVFKFVKNSVDSMNVSIPTMIVYHINKNKTHYNYELKTIVSDANEDKYLFGNFNQEYFKSKLSSLIGDNSLNNIPDKDSFEFKESEFITEHSTEITLGNISTLTYKLDIESNLNNMTLCYIPYLTENGVKLKYTINTMVSDNKLYYYNDDKDEFELLPKSTNVPWIYDHDFVNKKPGRSKQGNNLGKYLLLNKNGDLVMSSSKPIGHIYRKGHPNPSDSHLYHADIFEPYIFASARLFNK